MAIPATAIADQDAIISQHLDDVTANATADQTSDISQGDEVPAGDTSAFATATTPADVVSPALLGGVATSLSEVRLQPSEPIDPKRLKAILEQVSKRPERSP